MEGKGELTWGTGEKLADGRLSFAGAKHLSTVPYPIFDKQTGDAGRVIAVITKSAVAGFEAFDRFNIFEDLEPMR